MRADWGIRTFRLRGQVFQECAIIRVHKLTLLLHLLLDPYCSHDEWIDPSPDGSLVLLALVFEKLKKRPIVPQHRPLPNQGLNVHERAREGVEPVVSIREGVEALPEEEFRRGVDGEPRDEVFKVKRIVWIGVEHDVDNFLGVLFKEVEV